MTDQTMTHRQWLDDYNAHLEAGGKLEINAKQIWHAADCGPAWSSDRKDWRKVPLPRKATIKVAYRWGDGQWSDEHFHRHIVPDGDVDAYLNKGWSVQVIEVTEKLP